MARGAATIPARGGSRSRGAGKTLEAGKVVAQRAVEGGKLLADKIQEKFEEIRAERQDKADTQALAKAVCGHCGAEAPAAAAFCSACGNKVAVPGA